MLVARRRVAAEAIEDAAIGGRVSAEGALA
jgi:hypothetical protein